MRLDFLQLQRLGPIATVDIESTKVKADGTIDRIWCISWTYQGLYPDVKSLYWRNGVTYEQLAGEFNDCDARIALGQNPNMHFSLVKELREICAGETEYVPSFHNAQFDKVQLALAGLEFACYHDTLIMAFCLFPPTVMGSTGDEDALRFYSLSALANKGLCDAKMDFDSEWDHFSDEMLQYNRQDVLAQHQLGNTLKTMLMNDPQTLNAYVLDMWATEMCGQMRLNGIYVDQTELTNLTLSLEKELQETEEQLNKMYPCLPSSKDVVRVRPAASHLTTNAKRIHPRSDLGKLIPIGKKGSEYVYKEVVEFNPGSADHVLQALQFYCPDWTPTKFSRKTGKPSVSKDVIADLAETNVFADLIQRRRKLAKMLSTYLKPLSETDMVGRIHPSFLVAATRTSRFASRNPNFQNIPKDDRLRSIIKASSSDTVLVCIDLSQIELRILAWYMGNVLGKTDDSAWYLWRLYEKGADVHAANAARFGGIERKLAKIAIFLYIYGGGTYRLSASLGVTISQARKMLLALEKNVPALPQLKKYVEQSARQQGLLRTLYGHKIIYPEVNQRDEARVSRALRQYFNCIIQGTQADILKLIMAQTYKLLDIYGAFILLQVHDELVFEVPVGNAPLFCEALTPIFNNRKLLPGLIVKATPGIGRTWKEAKDDGERREKADGKK